VVRQPDPADEPSALPLLDRPRTEPVLAPVPPEALELRLGLGRRQRESARREVADDARIAVQARELVEVVVAPAAESKTSGLELDQRCCATPLRRAPSG
jgi:hypothetical protein